MKTVKKYPCENCGREVYVRSKGLCPACRSREKPAKKTSFRSKKKSAQRKGYSTFFEKHVEIVKNNGICCQECGSPLTGCVSEIAHILSKRNYPEVATDDRNVLYLCGAFSENRCHSKFDNGNSQRESMRVYTTARERVAQLLLDLPELPVTKELECLTKDVM